jgi:hypothetical protein
MADDWDFINDRTGSRPTAEAAWEVLLHAMLNREVTQHFYDDLVWLSGHFDIKPTLQDVAALNQRDELMNEPIWETLPDSLRAWLIWVDKDDIPDITDAVVSAAVAYYRQEAI